MDGLTCFSWLSNQHRCFLRLTACVLRRIVVDLDALALVKKHFWNCGPITGKSSQAKFKPVVRQAIQSSHSQFKFDWLKFVSVRVICTEQYTLFSPNMCTYNCPIVWLQGQCAIWFCTYLLGVFEILKRRFLQMHERIMMKFSQQPS